VQSTLETDGNREENDRVGFGGSFRVSDDFTLDGEISSGELGEGAKIGTEYIVSEKTSLYSNYTLENSSYDNGMRVRRGNWNSGVKSRLTDSLSIYGEEKYTHGDVPVGLTHAFGVEYSVKSGWDFGANLESGTLEDKRTASIVERQALGLNTAYHKDAITYSFASEYRVDNTENPDLSFSERTTWLIKNDFKYQINDDWRFVSRAHFSETESTQGDLFGGNFSEVVMGYGYRPVENDKWNALFKYTYFYNVPVSQLSISSPLTGQVSTLQNPDNNFIQKSHIMSLDFIYDLTESWSVGSKVAYRLGQVALDRTQPQYFDSRATLVVMRADWHFTKQWDALIEARQLKLPDAQDQRTGALIGIYRHIGNNLKVGLGYNFADFSDDLTDLDYNHQGVFINIVGKL
ncbi:MAG: flagellar motor protein MotB, partial [Gammaproteobacteria bacterium]|nr:flagellar motor protein MotB [Gammaproteobacteria bacterium]